MSQRVRVRFAALSFVCSLLATPTVRSESFFFKDGDRVVMMGDSITEQHLYSNYVEMWTVTRFPAWNLTFRNVGIGGDRSTGGNSRFARDVVKYKPTALTVDFGMNDGGYKPFDETTFKTYMGGLRGIADQAKAAGIRVAWITPQPLDEGSPGATARTGYNLTLESFSEGVKTIAERSDGLFVDQFHPYLAVLDKARAAGAKYDRITAGDAVHPGPPGQALMAYGILKGMGFPARVSSVEIALEPSTAGEARVHAENCRVSDVARDGDTLRFRRADQALPFFPDEARRILTWAPILEELNEYTLKVVGLKPGRYEVRLGGKVAAEFAADDLARGVNLAEAALRGGPVADQVKAVKAAIEAKNKYHHDRIFRGVVLAPANVPDWLGVKMSASDIDTRRRAALEERMAKMPELDDAIRQALVIRPHDVEIAPIAR
jgi:lysophospholipase L1-like esterase